MDHCLCYVRSQQAYLCSFLLDGLPSLAFFFPQQQHHRMKGVGRCEGQRWRKQIEGFWKLASGRSFSLIINNKTMIVNYRQLSSRTKDTTLVATLFQLPRVPKLRPSACRLFRPPSSSSPTTLVITLSSGAQQPASLKKIPVPGQYDDLQTPSDLEVPGVLGFYMYHNACRKLRKCCQFCGNHICHVHLDSLIIAVDGACPGNGTDQAVRSACGVYMATFEPTRPKTSAGALRRRSPS